MKTLNFRALSRSEMKEVKGGYSAQCDYQAQVVCVPSCEHFHTDYGRFATCMGTSIPGCSPLGEWGQICGDYN